MIATTEQVSIPNYRVSQGLHYWQLEYLSYFDRGFARFGMLEWHRRARKTTLAINQLIRQACKHAHCKYVYIGPTQVQTREMVWDDPNMLTNALPDRRQMNYKLNETKMLVKFANGSMVKFGGADNPDSIRGIDAVGVVPDEWAQQKPSVWTEIFRPIMSGEVSFPRRKSEGEISPDMRWALFLYTPKGPNHATMMFNNAACISDEGELPINGKSDKCKSGWFASRLTADISGILSQKELDLLLEEVEQGLIPLSLYEQEYQCKRVTDEERTLITSAMIERLKTRNWDSVRITQPAKRRIVAIDPAFGGDICDIKGIENGRVLEHKKLHFGGKGDTNDVVFEGKLVAKKICTRNFIIDCIGNGKGVADGLAADEMGYSVQYFDSAGKVENSSLYANRKAEAVNFVAGKIARCEVEPILEPETSRQLVYLSRYKVNNRGLMLMRPNDEVKKDLGCSPDDGLCYVYGIWGQERVSPVIEGEWKRKYKKVKDPMAF